MDGEGSEFLKSEKKINRGREGQAYLQVRPVKKIA